MYVLFSSLSFQSPGLAYLSSWKLGNTEYADSYKIKWPHNRLSCIASSKCKESISRRHTALEVETIGRTISLLILISSWYWLELLFEWKCITWYFWKDKLRWKPPDIPFARPGLFSPRPDLEHYQTSHYPQLLTCIDHCKMKTITLL